MREPGGDGTAGPGDLAGEAAAATFKLLANPRRGLAGYLAAAAAAAGPVQQMAHAVSPHWHLIRPQPAARVVSGMTRRAARRGWPPEHRDPGRRSGRLHGEGSSCPAALTIQAPARPHPRARPRGLPPAACRNTPWTPAEAGWPRCRAWAAQAPVPAVAGLARPRNRRLLGHATTRSPRRARADQR